jgi:hypothetical protein
MTAMPKQSTTVSCRPLSYPEAWAIDYHTPSKLQHTGPQFPRILYSTTSHTAQSDRITSPEIVALARASVCLSKQSALVV